MASSCGRSLPRELARGATGQLGPPDRGDEVSAHRRRPRGCSRRRPLGPRRGRGRLREPDRPLCGCARTPRARRRRGRVRAGRDARAESTVFLRRSPTRSPRSLPEMRAATTRLSGRSSPTSKLGRSSWRTLPSPTRCLRSKRWQAPENLRSSSNRSCCLARRGVSAPPRRGRPQFRERARVRRSSRPLWPRRASSRGVLPARVPNPLRQR